MLPHHDLHQHIANRHAEEVVFLIVQAHAVGETPKVFRVPKALIRSFG